MFHLPGEHLAGRVSWVAAVNPERGRALRQLLAEVGGEDVPEAQSSAKWNKR